MEQNENSREGEMIYALRHREGYSDVGARQDDWKILRVGQKKWQLFNIKNDPNEQENLVSKYPERVKDLKEKLANLKKDGFTNQHEVNLN